MIKSLFPEGTRRFLNRMFLFARWAWHPRFLFPLVVLVSLIVLVACDDDGGETATTATPPVADGTTTVETVPPVGTPPTPPSGELSISFTVECGGDAEAPEFTVTIQVMATDEAFISLVRVFVDGIQGLETEADDVQEFDERVSLAATPGEHQVRVSAEGGGLQRVTQPEEVTCPGTPEDEE